jgi:SAM-dependent methyltransferase
MAAARRLAAIGLVICVGLVPLEFASVAAQPDLRDPPTGPAVIDAMLRLAEVAPDDVVYDLGCGDGRVLITAARKLGARGVGVDPDPERIRQANENARLARLTDRVRFVQADVRDVDVRAATVVVLQVTPSLAAGLRPKLIADLQPGARVVSTQPDLDDHWAPERASRIGDREIFLWRAPPRGAEAGR